MREDDVLAGVEIGDEDLAALNELEERAVDRCTAEIERRSAAMVNAQQFWRH